MIDISQKSVWATFNYEGFGTSITVEYAIPTADISKGYKEKCLEIGRHGKVKSHSAEAAQIYGKKLLLNVKEGLLCDAGKVISSYPTSPNYDPNWKDKVPPYVFDSIARVCFELEEVEETPPFLSNSSPSTNIQPPAPSGVTLNASASV